MSQQQLYVQSTNGEQSTQQSDPRAALIVHPVYTFVVIADVDMVYEPRPTLQLCAQHLLCYAIQFGHAPWNSMHYDNEKCAVITHTCVARYNTAHNGARAAWW